VTIPYWLPWHGSSPDKPACVRTSPGLRGEFTGIRIDLSDELGRTRAAIMEKIAELNASVVAIRDDIAINMGAADAMQKANDNTRELVRLQAEQMSLMRKQIKQLQADVRDIKGTP